MPDLPVILLTGWGERPLSLAEHPGLADRILGKPLRLDDLLTVVPELTVRAAEPPGETA
jgi:hypothetical protein